MDSAIIKSYFRYRSNAMGCKRLTYVVYYTDGLEQRRCGVRCFIDSSKFKNRSEFAKEIIRLRALSKTTVLLFIWKHIHKPSLERIKELNTIISEYIKDSING